MTWNKRTAPLSRRLVSLDHPVPQPDDAVGMLGDVLFVRNHDDRVAIVVDGFDPRIHALYFCPQLYKYDPEKKLVPLQGEEIGTLIAHALEGGVQERRPWYEPSEKTPDQSIITGQLQSEFDTVVVELPNVRNSAATAS